ncbi:hypothetical protein [Saccharothrix longispora]|uniref:hypothetical protein n=1 Tax=Saccharothrix longispora TaxID=33920 RepID=UPI0028FD6275|nr:hypothetical protein [Saccharothrix longispora]MDU0288878.1 hypothetical protein [Saccharothrix longispora]
MRYETVVEAIGNTPLVRLADTGAVRAEMYAELETQNASAMEDLVTRQIILRDHDDHGRRPDREGQLTHACRPV